MLEQNSLEAASQTGNLNLKETKLNHKSMILAIICLAQFMVVLDVSVVNVALPAIHRALGFSASNLSWVVNSYTITFAGFLLLGGRAQDIFGHRRIFLLGLFIFTASSFLGGASQNQIELISARTLQGFGGAILSPATLTILISTFRDDKERSRALGLWSAVAAGGGAAGALVGGTLTDLISWRWILFVNIPIGIVAFVLASRILVKDSAFKKDVNLDLVGAILITSGLSLFIYGIVETYSHPWASTFTLSVIICSVLILLAFVIHEAKFAKNPLIPFGILKSRSLIASNGVMFIMSAAGFSMWFFVSLYMQNVLDFSPLKAGLAFIPQTVAIAIGATVSSRLLVKVGAKPFLIIGPILASIGLFFMTQVSPTESYQSVILIPGSLMTLGLGFTFAPVASLATQGILPKYAGLASGVVNTSRQIGGAIGLATLAAIAANSSKLYLTNYHKRVTLQTINMSQTHGWSVAFLISAILVLLGTLVALTIPKMEKRTN